MNAFKVTDGITCHQLSCLVVTTFVCPLPDDNKPLPYTFLTSRGNLILLLLEMIQHIDMDWAGLKSIFSKYFGNPQTALSLLEKRLSILHHDKCCELNEFIRSLDRLNICRKSLLGVFVRKVVLSYKKMTFVQLGKFEHALGQYLQEVSNDVLQIDEETVLHIEEEMEIIPETGSETKPSEDEEYLVDTVTHANQFISQQIALISSQNPSALPPRILQDKIGKILKTFPDNINVHFLAYLNFARVKEVNQSIIELHQYFDRKKWKEDDSLNTDAAGDRTAAESLQAKFKRFRYCALNLGILHFHQGHFQEAIASLEEAVKMAQETSDQDCLEHAMFWLMTIRSYRKEQPSMKTQSTELASSVKREILIPQLQSLGILQRCKDKAFEGSDGPASVIHDLHKAETIYPKIVNKMHVAKAALLDYYGMSSVATVTTQIPLYYGNDSGLSSVFKFCKGLDDFDYESHCLCLCQLAKFHADEGLYDEAECILNYGNRKISQVDELQKWITICRAQIRFDRAVLKRNLDEASSAAEIISVYDADDAQYRHCIVSFLESDVKAASEKTMALIRRYEEDLGGKERASRNPTDVIRVTNTTLYDVLLKDIGRLKVLMAEIRVTSEDVPGALSLLLEALSMARKYFTKGIESQVLVMIALCKIRLGLPHQALSLLNQAMIHILAHGSLYLRAFTFLSLAKCRFILLPKDDPTEMKAGLLAIIPYLEKCSGNFRRLSATTRMCETLCLQAHAYDMLEYTSERNRVAKDFTLVKASQGNCYTIPRSESSAPLFRSVVKAESRLASFCSF